MLSKEGRPYCLKALCYILKEDESTSKLTTVCKSCSHIIYVGCPGFLGKGTADQDAYNWLRWWYHEIPIPEKKQGVD